MCLTYLWHGSLDASNPKTCSSSQKKQRPPEFAFQKSCFESENTRWRPNQCSTKWKASMDSEEIMRWKIPPWVWRGLPSWASQSSALKGWIKMIKGNFGERERTNMTWLRSLLSLFWDYESRCLFKLVIMRIGRKIHIWMQNTKGWSGDSGVRCVSNQADVSTMYSCLRNERYSSWARWCFKKNLCCFFHAKNLFCMVGKMSKQICIKICIQCKTRLNICCELLKKILVRLL